jgi:biotin-dependent carboxylase-like uncharacterized protein
MLMTVLRTGPLVVIKDGGRVGHAALGVAPSGAADRGALARANFLVGNPAGAAALECTLGGLRVRFDEPAVVALTGTDATLTVDGAAFDPDEAVPVPAGAEVRLGMPRAGLRSYLAVRGGIDVPPVLGSRSTDPAGVGPPRPRPGDELPIGTLSEAGAAVAAVPLVTDEVIELEVDLGPREDWFTSEAVAVFLGEAYTVTPASDTVGLRLDGPALQRRRTEELPSEGVVRGSVQVPPDGKPIIFQADHPVTGGYPVIAVLTPEAADRAAQTRPGRRVRFVAAEPATSERVVLGALH